jgi:glucose/arabinose dehydrogenase
MLRRLLAPVVALVLAGACGDDDDSDASAPVPSPVTSGPATTAATTAPATSSPATVTTTQPGETTAPSTTPSPPADPAAANVVLTPVAELDQPIAIAWRPGDDETIYVAQQDGVVVALRPGSEPSVVLDLTDVTSADNEQGLLGLDFAADGGHAYLNYTDDESGNSHVVEVPVATDGTLARDGLRELLVVEQPYSNHNGGHVVVGPDGLVYLGFGDGGDGGDPHRYGLDLTTHLGKILRIDPTPSGGAAYTVPAGNPFVGNENARPEIWSYGLRNPWRFSFDQSTGDLFVGDVGQGDLEEVSWAPAGAGEPGGAGVNFGWSAFEGSIPFNQDQPIGGVTLPIHEYPHGELGCSITGGYLYRGTAIPQLAGAYVFADYCASGVRAFAVSPDGQAGEETFLTEDPGEVATFGESPTGELYVASLGGGVWRLDPAG